MEALGALQRPELSGNPLTCAGWTRERTSPLRRGASVSKEVPRTVALIRENIDSGRLHTDTRDAFGS